MTQTESYPPPGTRKNTLPLLAFPKGEKPFRLPRVLEVLLGIAVGLELIAPFFAKSYGVDGLSQLNLLNQFVDLVSHGVLLPRWAPQGVFGFGIASFYFYPPVAFYIGAFIHAVSGSTAPRFLFQMTGLVATIFSFFAARPLLQALGTSRYETNLGALLYAFAPFQIAEIYSRSSLSSHVAYVFVPLVWFGLVAITGRTRFRRVASIAVLGISSALLCLTSVPLALAMMLIIVIAGIVSHRFLTRKILGDAALAAVLAAALSAFHFSAVLSASPYVQLGDLTVINPEFLLNDILHGVDLPAAYHAGILYLGWLLAGIVYLRYRSKLSETERLASKIILFAGAFIALLELPFLSHLLWGHVQPFMLIQGCWRFYIQFVVAASVIVAIARTSVMKRIARAISWVWILGAIGPILLVILNFHLYPHSSGPGGDPTEYLPVYTINALTEGYQSIEKHQFNPNVIAVLKPGEDITTVWQGPTTEKVTAQLKQLTPVVFHQFYWPYWHLIRNGSDIPSHPDSLGRAVADLPAGNYMATWNLEVAPMEKAGRWISLLALCGLILGFAGHRIQSHFKGKWIQ